MVKTLGWLGGVHISFSTFFLTRGRGLSTFLGLRQKNIQVLIIRKSECEIEISNCDYKFIQMRQERYPNATVKISKCERYPNAKRKLSRCDD